MLDRLKRMRVVQRLLGVRHRVGYLESRVEALERQVLALKHGEFVSRDEVDVFKSRLEVSDELADEFLAWKQEADLPQEPLVSVVVITYNRARLLMDRCVRSVLDQTYKNFELIIVGDGCSDDTERLIPMIRDERVRFVNLAKRGWCPEEPVRRWMVAGTDAANYARDLACGDFVTHLDDDDEYLPERLERLVEFARKERCDFVWHPFWGQDDAGNWVLCECPEFTKGQVTNSNVFYRSWFVRIRGDHNAYRLMEPGDWNRFRRIKYVGPVARRLPEPLVRHYRETVTPREGGWALHPEKIAASYAGMAPAGSDREAGGRSR